MSSSSVNSNLSGMSLINQGFSSTLPRADQQTSNMVHQSQDRSQQQHYQYNPSGHAILGQGSTLSSNSVNNSLLGGNQVNNVANQGNNSSILNQSPSTSYEFAVRLASEANLKANNEKDYYEAIKLYGKAICLDSSDARFFLNRSYCYAQLELYQLALDDADSAIAVDKLSGKSYFRRGQALVGLRKFAEAEKSFQEVLKLDPECLETAKEIVNLRLLALTSLGVDEDKIRMIPLTAPALEVVLRQHSNKVLGWADSTTNHIPAGVANSWSHGNDHGLNNGVNTHSKTIGTPSLLQGNSNHHQSSWTSFDLLQHQQQESHFGQQHRHTEIMSGRSNTQQSSSQQTGVIGSSSQSSLLTQMNQQQVQHHNKVQGTQHVIGSQAGRGFGNNDQNASVNGGLGVIGSNNAWNRTIERPNSSSPQSNALIANSVEGSTPASSLNQMFVGNNAGNNSSSTNGVRGITAAGVLMKSPHEMLFNHEQMSSVSSEASVKDHVLNGSAINSFASAAAFNSQILGGNSSLHQELFRQQQTQTTLGGQRHSSGGSSSGIGSSSAEPPSISPSVSNTSSDGGVSGNTVSTSLYDKSLQEVKHQRGGQQPVNANSNGNSDKPTAPASVWGSSNASVGGTFADIVKKKSNNASEGKSETSKSSGWGDPENSLTGSQDENTSGINNVNAVNSNGGSSTQSKRPTNIWGYNGLRVANVSASASKSSLHALFSKFGRVKMIERITNKNVDNQIWVFFDNSTAPIDAIAKYQGVVLPGISLNNSSPLRFYFAATDDQKDLKFSRPKQPQDNRGECYYWRTTNCFSRESCSLRHIPSCKNIG